MPTTSFEQADRLVHHLKQQQEAWVAVDRPQRRAYLEACIQGMQTVAPAWVEAACTAKDMAANPALAGEEWLVGPATVILHMQQLRKTLTGIDRPIATAAKHPSQDTNIVRVFPDGLAEQLMWWGFRGEVWLAPGQPPTRGHIYRNSPSTGRVALVLGAGNVSATGILDALYQLFAANQVVLLKMNPVNAYLGEFLAQAFAPLCDAGWLAIVAGGAELGAYLCQHELIDVIHITGSHRTHNAIVWGSASAEAARVTQTPVLKKPITSELGCVTPILVVPGEWTAADIAFQAHQVASMVTNNASFNCVAAKVVVTATGWPQRQEFLDRLHQELAQIVPRPAYYPGALAQYTAACQHYGLPVVTAPPSPDHPIPPTLPWTIIPAVPPIAGEYALTEEIFCSVLAEVSLAATGAADFLAQAVEFANETVWGSLSCAILVDPQTQRREPAALSAAIAKLRYGAIGINVWTGVMYCLGVFPWGAYPGNPLHNIGSGQGFVHNATLIDHPQKSVLQAPFRIFPKPSWFANHRTTAQLGQRLTNYYAAPSLGKFLAVVWAALMG